MPEEIYEDENGQYTVINGERYLIKKSQAFIDRQSVLVQSEAMRRSDEDIYELIRARSNRRADITSITEAFDAGILNATKRDRALIIIENAWQVAVDKFQASE